MQQQSKSRDQVVQFLQQQQRAGNLAGFQGRLVYISVLLSTSTLYLIIREHITIQYLYNVRCNLLRVPVVYSVF